MPHAQLPVLSQSSPCVVQSSVPTGFSLQVGITPLLQTGHGVPPLLELDALELELDALELEDAAPPAPPAPPEPEEPDELLLLAEVDELDVVSPELLVDGDGGIVP